LEENVVLTRKLINANIVALGHKIEAFVAVASVFSIVVSVVDACVALIAVSAIETSVRAGCKLKLSKIGLTNFLP